MARKKREKLMSTCRTLSAKVSEYEHWLLKRMAEELGISLSEFVRFGVMNWAKMRHIGLYEKLQKEHQRAHEKVTDYGVQSDR